MYYSSIIYKNEDEIYACAADKYAYLEMFETVLEMRSL